PPARPPTRCLTPRPRRCGTPARRPARGRAAGGVSRPRRLAAARSPSSGPGPGPRPRRRRRPPTAPARACGRGPDAAPRSPSRAEPRRARAARAWRWRRAASSATRPSVRRTLARAAGERRPEQRSRRRRRRPRPGRRPSACRQGAPAHAEVVLPLCESMRRPARGQARETELEAEVRLGPAGQSIACRASAYASMDSPKQQSGRVTQACICVLRLYGLIIRIIKSRVSASARTPSPDSRPSEPAPRPHRRGLGGAGSRGRTGPPRPRELEDGASWRRRAPERPCGRVPTRRGRCGSARASLTARAAGKRVTVEYFAVLREQRAVASETVATSARTARDLYEELRQRHGFALEAGRLRVAVNGDFAPWERELADGDRLVFIPPVAGG